MLVNDKEMPMKDAYPVILLFGELDGLICDLLQFNPLCASKTSRHSDDDSRPATHLINFQASQMSFKYPVLWFANYFASLHLPLLHLQSQLASCKHLSCCQLSSQDSLRALTGGSESWIDIVSECSCTMQKSQHFVSVTEMQGVHWVFLLVCSAKCISGSTCSLLHAGIGTQLRSHQRQHYGRLQF